MADTPQLVQCNTCEGVYRTIFADGTLYFHACPVDRVTTPAVMERRAPAVVTALGWTSRRTRSLRIGERIPR